jgi:peptide/nickel transport system permease protein
MLQFIIRRIFVLVPMLFLMSIVAFGIILAPPGDYLTSYVAQLEASGDFLDQAEIEGLKKQFGLGRPVHEQYLKWVSRIVLHGDLGRSLEFNRPVNQLIGERLAMTLMLGLFTISFTWTMAIPIAIISAVKQYSFIDHFFTFLSYMGVGTPNFLLALVIMWFVFSIFGLKITGLFSQEYQDAGWSIGKFIDMVKHIWVPMLILGTDGTARFVRIIRANLLDELSKPYVETARAKGLPEWKVVMKYPVRIALNPFISTAGWQLPQLFSGSLIVATVLSLPTIGPLLLRSLFGQDMFLAGSIVLILTVLTMIGTLLSDILLALVDPRIRMGA